VKILKLRIGDQESLKEQLEQKLSLFKRDNGKSYVVIKLKSGLCIESTGTDIIARVLQRIGMEI
jgi:methylmalonyl-CoA mutase cobalamin-binding subunit